MGTFLASYINWLYPVFEAWQTQYNVTPRFTPSYDLLRCSNYSFATLACMVSRSVTQWKHLFMDWRPPSLPSYRLMKCGIDFKSQRKICPFLSYNPDSTPSLTGRRAILPAGGLVSCFYCFRTSVFTHTANNFNSFVFMPYSLRTITNFIAFSSIHGVMVL